MRPTEEITAALDGSLSPDQLAPASRSAFAFSIYKIACIVLKVVGNKPKREAIESYPISIQPLIKAECRRIFDYRRGAI